MAEMITTMNPQMDKKYILKDEEYASKGVAGTALGLGIGALGWNLLQNNGLGNILGGGSNKQKEQDEALFGVYKGYRDSDDAIIAKHNEDSFKLYQGYTNQGIALQKEIDDLKTKLAVAEAVRPYQDKAIYDAIAIEKERRECADCQIVGYSNCTFIPQYIADLTPATTSTPKTIYNPLSCMNNRGCNCGC